MSKKEFRFWIAFCVLSVSFITPALIKVWREDKTYHRSVEQTDYVRKWLRSVDSSASIAITTANDCP